MLDSATVIISEIALALYPILIKTIPTDIITQITSRLLTYTVLGLVMAKESYIFTTWGSSGILRSLGLGLVTLIHIASSYIGYKELPSGIAQSLFYVYPILILIGGIVGLNEPFSWMSIVLIVVAFLGVILVAMSQEIKNQLPTDLNPMGLTAVTIAAITETITYFAVRSAKESSPFFAVLELYPAALLGLLAYLGITGKSIDTRASVWFPMILFNTLIGFVGYCLRFYAIPRLPTVVFSLLSFIGVLASFIWGFLFVKEIPTTQALLGATLITSAVGASRFIGMK